MDNNRPALKENMLVCLSQLKLYPAPLMEEETKFE